MRSEKSEKSQKAEGRSKIGRVSGLNPKRVTLDNGVTVIAKSNHTTPAVSTLVGVRTGAFADPAGRDGTAALCARVLDRGTVTRIADAIADDLDGRGASLSVVAGRHQIGARRHLPVGRLRRGPRRWWPTSRAIRHLPRPRLRRAATT